MVVAATRRAGLGRVTSVAFAPTAREVERLVAQSEQPPRDPRFSISWSGESELRVALDAIDRASTRPYLTISSPPCGSWGKDSPSSRFR
jgi:hypothetical protein